MTPSRQHWDLLEHEQSDKPCPIPGTHRRLQEAHELWHQVCDYYHSPRRFRTNLNAMIQALRNVTFILQKEKAKVPGFDEWYQGVREGLASDPILQWLHQARNLVVKEGDIQVASTAKVTVANWLELAKATLEVPPQLSAEEIGHHLRRSQQKFLSQFDNHEAILCVERFWAVKELPDKDLVDVLAYGYCELERIISEAHHRCGHQMEIVRLPDMKVIGGRRLPCMKSSEHFRAAHISLKNGLPITLTEREFSPNQKSMERARRRYQLTEPEGFLNNYSDPFAHAPA